MKIDAARIKSWVERIEGLLAERKGINGDIKDIYTEITKGDHDAKAIRKLIQRRAQDEGELAEQDALLSAYTDAVAGKIKALEAIERGANVKDAAKAGGISTGAVSALTRVQKSRKLNATQAPPHDSETGEISDSRVAEDVDGQQAGRGGAIDGRRSDDPPLASKPESKASLAGEAEAPAPITQSCGQPDRASAEVGGDETVAPSGPQDAPQKVTAGNPRPEGTEIDLTIPGFLRREVAPLRSAADPGSRSAQ